VRVPVIGEHLGRNKIFDESERLSGGDVIAVDDFSFAERSFEGDVSTDDVFVDVFGKGRRV
jgi:hypothetical protein